jgi:hypothetical protein
MLLGHPHCEQRRILGRLARCEYDLRDSSTQVASEVEARSAAELIELHPPDLGKGLVFAQLPGDEPAQHVPHSPNRTSRIRCQCVPAQ